MSLDDKDKDSNTNSLSKSSDSATNAKIPNNNSYGFGQRAGQLTESLKEKEKEKEKGSRFLTPQQDKKREAGLKPIHLKSRHALIQKGESSISRHPFRHLVFSPSVEAAVFQKHLFITHMGLTYAKFSLKGPSVKYLQYKGVLLKASAESKQTISRQTTKHC
jgi:hypothetical protein